MSSELMKVAIVKKPNKLIVEEIPMPNISPYAVLVKQKYGATCSGTDSHIINGTFPYYVKYPTILGHESVGEVVEKGSKVRNIQIGDNISRVCLPHMEELGISSNYGGFGEYGIAYDHWAMCADGLEEMLWRKHRVNQIIPRAIDLRQAAMLTTWRETLSYIQRAGFKSGMDILIAGSGGNGLSFAAHAKNLGASSVVMIGSPKRKQVAIDVGVDVFYSYKEDDVYETIRDNFPKGFDMALDAIGKNGIADNILSLLKQDGIFGIYGIDDLKTHSVNLITLSKSFYFYNSGYDESETHQEVCEMIMSGKLNAKYWLNIVNPYDITEINKAFDGIKERKHIKALIKLG